MFKKIRCVLEINTSFPVFGSIIKSYGKKLHQRKSGEMISLWDF